MKSFLTQEFGIIPSEIKRIDGYENANYIISQKTERYIFKTYTYDAKLLDILEAENRILSQLTEKTCSSYPKPIPFTNGDFIKVLDLHGQPTICRMLSFLDGDFMGDIPPSKASFRSLGLFLANMDLQLQQMESYVLRARQSEWDLQYLHLNTKFIDDITDAHDRNIVRYFFLQFEEKARPVLPKLRKQIIHNDANEWNLLTKEGKLSGVIDFGDLTHAPLINELAIAITYACYDTENPLEWATPILEAYHEVLPLTEIELSVLYYLIAARLCTSVCNSSHSKKKDPENTYATSSEKKAWSMLYKWLRINPIAAENVFRKTVGFSTLKTPSIKQSIQRRHEYLSPILSMSYKEPIQMAGAAFQYMYDINGNTFLDAYNNIPHVGHSHPKVVMAGQRQMAQLNTNTRYVYPQLADYAERLLSKFPDTLNKVFFVNSGSAASDLAMRMAHGHTGQKKMMVMEHGYHGNTQIGIDISDYKFNNPKGQGQKDYILKTPIPNTYKGKYTGKDAGALYAREAIVQITQSTTPIAAFVSEPIVGCGGQVPLAPGYLKELYPAIRKQGGICISDEVQTGFGRLGTHFWGFETQDVIPDMVILGKPMGNGHPIGAVVTTTAIAESFGKGVEFFSSFGGNPVSCAIGYSVLEVIEEERLQKHVKDVGDYYLGLLRELQQNYTCIGDVRGSGLFIGIEIVKENEDTPNRKLAQHIKNELRNQYILISTDGPEDSVLKTKPPLCFTKDNAAEVVEAIAAILKSYTQ
jgi:4-aminobutyrate aminotransferase-like enzyme/Ser/Thr protein kinase RdoA (MazF antagonist)